MKLDRTKRKKTSRANLRQRNIHITWVIRGKSTWFNTWNLQLKLWNYDNLIQKTKKKYKSSFFLKKINVEREIEK